MIANGGCFLKQQINEIQFKTLPEMSSVYFLIKQRSQRGSCNFVGLMIAEHEKKKIQTLRGWKDGRLNDKILDDQSFLIIHLLCRVQKWFISGKMTFKLLCFFQVLFPDLFFPELIPQGKVYFKFSHSTLLCGKCVFLFLHRCEPDSLVIMPEGLQSLVGRGVAWFKGIFTLALLKIMIISP